MVTPGRHAAISTIILMAITGAIQGCRTYNSGELWDTDTRLELEKLDCSPCENPPSIYPVAEIVLPHQEYDAERDCMVNKQYLADMKPFCEYSGIPGTAAFKGCPQHATFFANDVEGRCIRFDEDCIEGNTHYLGDWNADTTWCESKPLCADGHEELRPEHR